MNGFLKIERSEFGDFLFQEKRVFSRFEAWIDLCQLSTYQESRTVLINGKSMVCSRGQVIASLRFLESRWLWSRHKVSNFLGLLTGESKIAIDRTDNIGRITVFQNMEQEDKRDSASERDRQIIDPPAIPEDNGTGDETGKGQTRDSKGTNTKKGRKEKNNKTPASPFKNDLFSSDPIGDEHIEDSEKDSRPQPGVELPFSSVAFAGIWQKWKKYKTAQFRQRYANDESEAAALAHLLNLSGGSETVAIAIILQSMGNTWRGLFPYQVNPAEHPAQGKKMIY